VRAEGASQVVVLASNYGEAGAVERYGEPATRSSVYSGHMGFWYWGPPRAAPTAPAVTVGEDRAFLLRWFSTCGPAGRLDNHVDLDDDEQGASLFVCRGLRGTWAGVWPSLRAEG